MPATSAFGTQGSKTKGRRGESTENARKLLLPHKLIYKKTGQRPSNTRHGAEDHENLGCRSLRERSTKQARKRVAPVECYIAMR